MITSHYVDLITHGVLDGTSNKKKYKLEEIKNEIIRKSNIHHFKEIEIIRSDKFY